MTTSVTAASRQARLFDVLACPDCGGPLSVDDPVRRADGVAAGDLSCPAHGRVGVIDRHRPSFLARELDRLTKGSAADRRVESPAPNDLVTTTGRWWPLAEGWAGAAEPGVAMAVEGRLTGARFEVLRDAWSPVVELLVDGKVTTRQDLSVEATAEPMACSLPAPGEHRVELRVVDSNPDGRVVVTESVIETMAADLRAPGCVPVDRGNPYPQGFLDLLGAIPDTALALDCGGGDRRLGDDRLFNLEYLPYEAPDLYADGLHLPIAESTFDLVLSQAVLEHVPDPQRATDELRRILRPGGRIYCEIAFMQPLHAVPSHYFNVTPHGAAHLFRDWDVETLDWFGGVAVTIDWWMRILEMDSRWHPEKLARFTELVSEIDSLTTHDELQSFASGVLVVATKPEDHGSWAAAG